eukprot:4224330-Pyramimonas_sp.AAC.2
MSAGGGGARGEGYRTHHAAGGVRGLECGERVHAARCRRAGDHTAVKPLLSHFINSFKTYFMPLYH